MFVNPFERKNTIFSTQIPIEYFGNDNEILKNNVASKYIPGSEDKIVKLKAEERSLPLAVPGSILQASSYKLII